MILVLHAWMGQIFLFSGLRMTRFSALSGPFATEINGGN